MRRATFVGLLMVSAVITAALSLAQTGNPDIAGMLQSQGLVFRTVVDGDRTAYVLPFKADNHPDLRVIVLTSPKGSFVAIYAKVIDLPADVNGSVFRTLIEEQGKVWLGKFAIGDGGKSLFFAIETTARRLDGDELGYLIRQTAQYVDENYPRLKNLVNGRTGNGI